MKKSTFFIVFIPVLMCLSTLAQSPQKIDYQAIVRNAQGLIMNDRAVIFRFTIHSLSPDGNIIYQEIHETSTNQFGLVTLAIGAGTPLTGSFAGINWLSGGKYIQVEIKFDAGDAYSDMGTSQLISVPYAFYSDKAGGLSTENDHDTSSTNELQTLSIISNRLTISKGNTVILPVDSNDFDKDPVNEIQVITISHDTIFLSRNGGRVKLPSSPITGSGQNGYITFWASPSSLSGDNKLFWDNSNKRLGLGLTNPAKQLDITQSFQLPNTSDANTGIIFKNGISFLHNYGTDNVFIGKCAGNFTLSAAASNSNVGVGGFALRQLTIGYSNIALGMYSLYACKSGAGNIAIGHAALYCDTSGSSNNAIGHYSMEKNTSGMYNIAMGLQSLRYNMTGTANVSIGVSALLNNSSGIYNIACGYSALSSNRNGGYNIGIGTYALNKNKTGNNNIAIGYYADVKDSVNMYTNITVIGFQTVADASNQVRLGNNSVTTFYCKGVVNAVADTLPNVYVSPNGQIKRSTSVIRNITGSGSANQVSFWTSANALSSDSKLYWNNSRKFLGVGITNPARQLDLGQSMQLPNTSNDSTGIIFRNGKRTMHNYGTSNLFVGVNAGNFSLNVSSSKNNTGIGDSSLILLSTGSNNTATGQSALMKNLSGSNNVASGYKALFNNSIGSYNTVIGSNASFNNSNGVSNTAIGNLSLFYNAKGCYNTAIGEKALYNDYGFYNTAVGYRALYNNVNGSYNTALGYGADVSDTTVKRSTAIGYGAKADTSNMIKLGNDSVRRIVAHVPLTITSDMRFKKDIREISSGLSFIMQLNPVEYRLTNGDERINFGFIAQDIQKLVGSTNAILTIGSTKEHTLGLRYSDFIAPMVKAIQEQQEQIRQLSQLNLDLTEKLDKLQKVMEQMMADQK